MNVSYRRKIPRDKISPEVMDDNGFRMLEKVDPSTVCQFTGLTDMNGREIWEHDLISVEYKTREVLFRCGVFCFIDDDYKRQLLAFFAKACEVQGTIFENRSVK